MTALVPGDQVNNLGSEGQVAGMSMIDRDRLNETETEAELSIMEEIGNTVTENRAKAREPEVFEVEDVETSVDTTVDLDDEAPEHGDRDHKALHIDLSGEGEEILLDEEVVTGNPTEEDPKDILDQDTESEETATRDTSNQAPISIRKELQAKK